MQNSHIITSLNSYIENPDPRYALMLKGKWGCGKTYLVNQWIEDTFKKPKKKDDIVLEPIRISLYGMTKTEQITKAIDRQLHPYLYTKAAKIGAGILKIAGKVVLRTDLTSTVMDITMLLFQLHWILYPFLLRRTKILNLVH